MIETSSGRSDSFLFLLLRRMRIPLIVLISAYAFATVGFTLMPGVDDQGNPWRMSFFEAFYVVSYTGTTIGFGEVPYDFTPAQRMWTMVSIYVTVIAWLFSIGSIISLVQDPAYIRALKHSRRRRAVRHLAEPFYMVCGYGDTGRMLTRALTDQGHPVVVIEHNGDKIDGLSVEEFGAEVISFQSDARLPDHLVDAGLRSRWCLGVLAVTGDDRANLKVAISSKLLNHKAAVHARADSRAVADNMRSFETDHVINPVAEFVRRMTLAIERPNAFRLYQWLASGPSARIPETRQPPRGRWVLCGYGRPGRALHAALKDLGMEVAVIAPDADDPPPGFIDAIGTDAEDLQAAGIEEAVGVLATSTDDADNLSILITARALNEDLFVGALENGLSTHALFRAAEPDVLGQPSTVVAGAILGRVRSSLMGDFLDHVLEADDAFAGKVLEALRSHGVESPPEISSGRISARRAPAVARVLEAGGEVSVGALLRDAGNRDRRLPLSVLMIARDDEPLLWPDEDTPLQSGDRLLLAGRPGAARRVSALLENDQALAYVLTGKEILQGWFWDWLERRRAGRAGSA
ncbi:potassium channel protein [Wenzhouxiangella sp. XN79A]|uniref:potassium channel family protein n=1 Tax=Wenzhouxiangella sp. XN79A TaxID=2724193 RepID=UPI00144A9FDC|nr:NAD-binding protein [Wenzhouxiangella sp. XN79A]NKI35195.1 potassium channel protein [Wenzhouxiangella sp. XN79A]